LPGNSDAISGGLVRARRFAERLDKRQNILGARLEGGAVDDQTGRNLGDRLDLYQAVRKPSARMAPMSGLRRAASRTPLTRLTILAGRIENPCGD